MKNQIWEQRQENNEILQSSIRAPVNGSVITPHVIPHYDVGQWDHNSSNIPETN